MPNVVLNGDFEAGTGSTIPYWTITSGTATIITSGFQGKQAVKLGDPAIASRIKQSFSPYIKSSMYSQWTSGSGTLDIKFFYADGTTETINPPLFTTWRKYQKIWSPAKYITDIEIRNDSFGAGVAFAVDEAQLWEESLPVEESDQPKISAQIFRGVHPQSEDNWLRGYIVAGSGSAHTDGDVLTLYFTGSGNHAQFTFSLGQTIDINTYKTMVARFRGNTSYNIFLVSGSTAYTVDNKTAPSDWTIRTYDLTASTINPIDSFIVSTTGSSAGQFTQWDYVFFTTGSYLDVTEDLVEGEIRRAAVEAGNFSIDLNNDNGKYFTGSKKITYWDDILIYGGYKSTTGSLNYEKMFGGKIEELEPSISAAGGSILKVSGRDYSSGLINTMAFMSYGTTGSLIPSSVVTPTPGFMANDLVNRFTNASGTGYRIHSTLTGSDKGNAANTIGGYAQWLTGSRIEYYEVRNRPVLDGLKELAELHWATQFTGSGLIIGDTPIQSYEYYISPARALHFEQMGNTTIRGKKFGKTLAVGDNILDIKPQTDINNMKNKIRYFSTFLLPPDGDNWTENTAGSWIPSSGITDNPAGLRIINESSLSSMIGASSPRLEITGSGQTTIFMAYAFPPINFYSLGSRISIPNLTFYFRGWGRAPDKWFLFDLRATTTANSDYFSYRINGIQTGSAASMPEFVWPSNSNEWFYISVPIGPYAPTGSGLDNWIKTGNPGWNNIGRLDFGFTNITTFADSGSIDGLRIEGFRYDIAKDSTSISKYGLRESFITDPIIKDSGSAPLFAKAELFKFRTPISRGRIKTRFYPTMHPGQLVAIDYPEGNINNQDFRIIRVNHDFSDRGLTTFCEVTSDTGSQTPLERSKIINYITQGAGLTSRSINDLMSLSFDPFMTAQEIDYPS